MIIVNLKGGLGNQMFQYALGRTLALKHNDTLKLDISTLSRAHELGVVYRPFSLQSFNVIQNIATRDEINHLAYPYGLLSKLTRTISARVLKRTHVCFEPTILNLTGDQYLDGYWQSPRFFEDIRGTLITEFTLRTPLPETGEFYKQALTQDGSVSLHVRRGDYATNPKTTGEMGVCSLEYYKIAIEHIRTVVDTPRFFVFSDDIAWAREHLLLEESEVIFVSDASLTDAMELALMSLAKHNIIANSSFSWWSAWLNQNPSKVVIAPTPWFNTVRFDTHLLPESWIQLPK